MTVPVVATYADFRVAAAELPRSSRLVDDARGAVVVTAGSAENLRHAVERGAAAIVAVRPEGDLPEVGVPVVVDRPLLRPDVAADARSVDAPALVQIETSAAAGDAAATLRDAIGWARVLAGGPLTLQARQDAGDAVSALLAAAVPGGSVPIALVMTVRPGTSPWLRATAIGAQRREVVLDVARGLVRLERTTAEGRTFTPTRWEAPARLALRRALDAVGGARPADLEEWNEDDALARALLTPRGAGGR
jgi:hypothetical protein